MPWFVNDPYLPNVLESVQYFTETDPTQLQWLQCNLLWQFHCQVLVYVPDRLRLSLLCLTRLWKQFFWRKAFCLRVRSFFVARNTSLALKSDGNRVVAGRRQWKAGCWGRSYERNYWQDYISKVMAESLTNFQNLDGTRTYFAWFQSDTYWARLGLTLKRLVCINHLHKKYVNTRPRFESNIIPLQWHYLIVPVDV